MIKLFNMRNNLFLNELFIFLISYKLISYRSSRLEVFCKKVVLWNFAKFTGKHLCQTLFFNKVAGQPVNFAKLLRTPCFIEHLWWLLLNLPSTRLFVLKTSWRRLEDMSWRRLQDVLAANKIFVLFWNTSSISILRIKISEIGEWANEAIKTKF